jgi:hypothetical protein
MGSHGDTVLDSGGRLSVQPNCAAALLFSQQEARAILPPRSGRVRARCELFGRSQLWPQKPTFKRKTGRSESGQKRRFGRRPITSGLPPTADILSSPSGCLKRARTGLVHRKMGLYSTSPKVSDGHSGSPARRNPSVYRARSSGC